MTPESIPQVRVLFVDDHPVVRSGVKAPLKSSGKLRLTAEAGTGEAALEIPATSAQHVDVVVMDLQMGAGATGYLLKDAASETVQHAVLDAAARKPVLSP